MFEQGLFSLITGDAGVSALIVDRLYPVQGVPDKPTFPYVTYQPVTAGSDYTLDGAEARQQRLQFDCWALSALDNLNVLIALRNLLSGFSGTLSDETRVLFTSRENEMANFDNNAKSYRSVCEYEFLFSEP